MTDADDHLLDAYRVFALVSDGPEEFDLKLEGLRQAATIVPEIQADVDLLVRFRRRFVEYVGSPEGERQADTLRTTKFAIAEAMLARGLNPDDVRR